MSYLGQEELALYTDQPITMLDAENASLGIDAYKGTSFWAKKYTEQVKLCLLYTSVRRSDM